MKHFTLTTLLFTLSTTLFARDNNAWYTPLQSHLVYVDTPKGEVVIALTDSVAPQHAKRFTDLVNAGFYDGRYFYRVVDGFVAQGGSNEEVDETALTTPLKAEFTATGLGERFIPVQTPALFAPVTGFIDGFAAASDEKGEQFWLTHCPGAVAMARNSDADSGDTEFYIVIGQAPRHLDRNMSVFGRVIAGMEALQALPRGLRENSGVIEAPGENSEIRTMRMGTSLPKESQRHFRIQLANNADYLEKINAAKVMKGDFFHDRTYTPRPIDVCYYQTAVEEL